MGFLSSLVISTLTIPVNVRPVHRAFYRLLARYFGPETPWHFMNYGYDSLRFRQYPIKLRPEDDTDRLCIQMYDHLLSSVPLAESCVLEVGCGRGGGAAYIARYLRPSRVVGVDLCHQAIRICRSNHGDQRTKFLTGDAQRLPFRDATFDVVVNVESSHAYASMASFLEEIKRVLKPGGFFVFADLRWDAPAGASTRLRGLTLLHEQLLNCGLPVVQEADLSGGVLQARTADNDPRRTSIKRLVPLGLRTVFAELAGLPQTTMYQRLAGRKLVYWSSLLQKPVRPT